MLEISRIRNDYDAVVDGFHKRHLPADTMLLVD